MSNHACKTDLSNITRCGTSPAGVPSATRMPTPLESRATLQDCSPYSQLQALVSRHSVGAQLPGTKPDSQCAMLSRNCWFCSAPSDPSPIHVSSPASWAVNIAASPNTATRPSPTCLTAP